MYYFCERVIRFVEKVMVPIWKIQYWTIRFEFQNRGAIHAHCLLSSLDGPNQIDADLAFKTKLPPGDKSRAQAYEDFKELTVESEIDQYRRTYFHNNEQAEKEAQECFNKLELIRKAREKYITFLVKKLGVSEINPNLDPKTWKPPLGQVNI